MGVTLCPILLCAGTISGWNLCRACTCCPSLHVFVYLYQLSCVWKMFSSITLGSYRHSIQLGWCSMLYCHPRVNILLEDFRIYYLNVFLCTKMLKYPWAKWKRKNYNNVKNSDLLVPIINYYRENYYYFHLPYATK